MFIPITKILKKSVPRLKEEEKEDLAEKSIQKKGDAAQKEKAEEQKTDR